MLDSLKTFNDAKKIFISYIVISLVVYFEIYLVSTYLASPYYDTFEKGYFDINFLLSKCYGWLLLFLTLLVFIIKKSHLDFRKKINIPCLILHILFISVFIYLLSIIGSFSFLLLRETIYISKLIQPLGITFSDFTIKFIVLFLLLFSGLHYSLLLSFFSSEKIYVKYISSFFIALIALPLIKGVTNFLQKYLIYGVANIVYLFLNISGFNAQILGHFDTPPTVGTDIFRVRIYEGCSGLEGISAFLLAFMILVLLNRRRIKMANALVVAFAGIFMMYVVNVLRIYVLILIGHFYGSKIAVDLWHSHGSAFLYAIAIIAILAVSNRWMLSAVSGKPASD